MGKFDLNPEELKKFDLTPEENAPKSKYPQPRSMTPGLPAKNGRVESPDDEVGAGSGPTRNLRVLEPGFPGTTEDAIGAAMRDYVDQRHVAALKSFGKEVGAQTAGGALSAGLAAGVKPSTVATGINSLSNFAKNGSSGTFVGAFLNYWKNRMLGEEAANIAAKNMGKILPKAGDVARDVASAEAGGAGVAAGRVITNPSASAEPKPFKGTMSNAIDRLRVAAQSDARARDLLSRIEGTNDVGTGEVTQSTLGAQQ